MKGEVVKSGRGVVRSGGCEGEGCEGGGCEGEGCEGGGCEGEGCEGGGCEVQVHPPLLNLPYHCVPSLKLPPFPSSSPTRSESGSRPYPLRPAAVTEEGHHNWNLRCTV